MEARRLLAGLMMEPTRPSEVQRGAHVLGPGRSWAATPLEGNEARGARRVPWEESPIRGPPVALRAVVAVRTAPVHTARRTRCDSTDGIASHLPALHRHRSALAETQDPRRPNRPLLVESLARRSKTASHFLSARVSEPASLIQALPTTSPALRPSSTIAASPSARHRDRSFHLVSPSPSPLPCHCQPGSRPQHTADHPAHTSTR